MANYTTFQQGTLVKRENSMGFTWVLRYNADGKRKAMVLGTSKDLPTEAAARHKASTMTAVINESKVVRTFGQLLERYIKEELPLIRPKTQKTNLSNIKHIRARWEDVSIDDMLKDLVAIQNWVANLQTQPRKLAGGGSQAGHPMAKQTRQHIKNLLHRIFECSMLWGYLPVDRNPISLVEIKRSTGVQPVKRLKYPLTVDEAKALMNYLALSEHVRVMVKLSIFLGLRISEVLGLKWDDIDFAKLEIHIRRSVVDGHVDMTKAEASETKVPIDVEIAMILQAWKMHTESVGGWLFGSAITGKPFYANSLQHDHLAPAGAALGIRNLGWHSFRHSFENWLRESKVDPTTQMMLMRQADIKTTNMYGRDDGSMKIKREARDGMMTAVFGGAK